MSTSGTPVGVVVRDIPRGLSEEVIKQYFFSRGGDIAVFQFFEDDRVAHIVYEKSGAVTEVLSSTHKIGRHTVKVTGMEPEERVTVQSQSGVPTEDQAKEVAIGAYEDLYSESSLINRTLVSTVSSSPPVVKTIEFAPQEWKVISTVRQGMVQGIESQAKKWDVVVSYSKETSPFSIKVVGTMPHVMEAMKSFEELKKFVHLSSGTISYKPGLWTVLKSMKDTLALFEHDYNVGIKIEAIPSSAPKPADCHIAFSAQVGESTIQICFGNFTQHPSVTTIINLLTPNVDECHLTELVEAGGEKVYDDVRFRMRELSMSELPQVFETKPYNLSIQKLIHCVVCKWKKSDEVAKILEEGIKRAVISASSPCIVFAPGSSIQCPTVVLAELLAKVIVSRSKSFAGFQFALHVACKEDARAIEQYFKSQHVVVKFGDDYKLLRASKQDDYLSNTHLRVLQSDFLSFLSVVHEDLLQQKVDVYVNSTNPELDLSQGMLSKQLLKRMGQKLQDKCKEYAPLAVGGVAVTPTQNLFCKYIVHVCLSSFKAKGSIKILREAVQNILQICFDKSLTSIAFPSIGTGNLGYPSNIVADVIFSEVIAFSEKHPLYFKRVVLVLPERSKFQSFMKVFAEKLQVHSIENVTSETRGTLIERHSAKLFIQCGFESEIIDVIINPIGPDSDPSKNPLQQLVSKGAGEALQALCSQLLENGVIVNDKMCVFTKASGQLRCKKVLHVCNPEEKNSSSTLHSVVLSALKQTENEKYKSLCMPVFGFGMPLEKRTTTIIEACVEFGESNPDSLKKIILLANDRDSYDKACVCLANVKAASHFQSDHKVQRGLNFMDLEYWTHVPCKQRSFQPWDTVDFAMLQNKDAVIDIYCSAKKQGDMIINDIESRVSKQIVVDSIDDDSIPRLIASEVMDIRKKIRTLGVGMELSRERSRITLSGEKARVGDAKAHIVKVLGNLKHARSLLNEVVWQRQGSSGLQSIHMEISCRLEMARMKDVHMLKVHCEDCSSVFDLKSMLEIDIDSGRTSSIYRKEKHKLDLPPYWQPLPVEKGEKKACHLFKVSSNTKEYENAVKEFRQTMYGIKFTVVSLERIQNFDEYSKHCAFLDVLKRKYNGDVLVKRLFHGTSLLSVEAIAHQGFNRIFAADANAAMFGKGVYFASRANYSAQAKYSVPDECGNQKMFICRVVVGKFTKGEKTMKVAPPLDASKNKHMLFDSLVDNVANPTIYVVMSDSQAYPEYVVTFKTSK